METPGDQHMMPGLIEPLVREFDAPRKHLTTRGVARNKGVPETFVVTALLRDTRQEMRELRLALGTYIGMRPVESAREFIARMRQQEAA
jgi:hypothetical protein